MKTEKLKNLATNKLNALDLSELTTEKLNNTCGGFALTNTQKTALGYIACAFGGAIAFTLSYMIFQYYKLGIRDNIYHTKRVRNVEIKGYFEVDVPEGYNNKCPLNSLTGGVNKNFYAELTQKYLYEDATKLENICGAQKKHSEKITQRDSVGAYVDVEKFIKTGSPANVKEFLVDAKYIDPNADLSKEELDKAKSKYLNEDLVKIRYDIPSLISRFCDTCETIYLEKKGKTLGASGLLGACLGSLGYWIKQKLKKDNKAEQLVEAP